MPRSNIDRLRETLDELFMLDQADLDFGLYRIMNVRRDEIRRFLDRDLLPKVRKALGQMQESERAALQAQLDDATEQARKLGFNSPSEAPRVRELQEKLQEEADIWEDEVEVYGHLISFFRRYFKEGDFISLRRYKDGAYVIPYEGEEVKLHWANSDQYYIKTIEQFQDYTFIVFDEGEPHRRVHFKLVSANTERNNNTAQVGQERRFMLAENESVAEVAGELCVPFEYRPANGAKQAALNTEAEDTILGNPVAEAWSTALARDVRREGAKDPLSLLRKHINTYTAKNTYDYFIHKDLGGFLRRELDFYLKNEVLRLDDIDTDGATPLTLDGQLRKVKAIRAVGLPIIDFVASLEEFQKLLWLKKKFVVHTHWCVTLDRVPLGLYPAIAKNERQRQEWVRLFSIDDFKGEMITPDYSEPLSEAFLEAHQHLVVDTSLFDRDFTEQLLSSIDDLDEATDGLLVHGENFHALGLLQARYQASLRSIYIDPPYNTDASPIAYKNGYRSSSWVSLMQDRLLASRPFLADDGIICVTIDDYQVHELATLMSQTFDRENYLGTIVIRNNPSGRSTVSGFSVSHEYAFFYRSSDAAAVSRLPRSESQLGRFSLEDGQHVDWRNFRKDGGAVTHRTARPRQFYPLYVDLQTGLVRIPCMTWDATAQAWQTQEKASSNETMVLPIDDRGRERVWSLGHESARQSVGDLRARVGRDGGPQVDRRHTPSAGVLPRTWWDKKTYAAREYGSSALSDMFGEGGVFSFAKSPFATQDCLWVSGMDDGDGMVLDYFAGSGTTSHAVINLNREDDGQRKYILVEMGEYFDTVLKPRVLKAVYSKDWKDGKPVKRDGVSQIIKVIRLESYEDTLANLRVQRTQRQTNLLEKADERFREQYTLRYWITEETRGSTSLLDIERFDNPSSYTLEVGQSSANEAKPVAIDLVETFNYLLGLRVRRVDRISGVTLVQGTLPLAPGHVTGEKALVVWRDTREMDAGALDKFLWGQRINPHDMEFDVIYVNGDNYLENSRRPDETWKVRFIEDEFQHLMFAAVERERR